MSLKKGLILLGLIFLLTSIVNANEAQDLLRKARDEYYKSIEGQEKAKKEAAMLNKTPPAVKKAAKAYARSASGKKAKKVSAKKRAKYASKINACSEKGKTFSFKAMTCVKSKKQR